jgi:hypothetical protein
MMPTQTTIISIESWLGALAQWLPLRQAAHIGAIPPAICNTVLQGVPLLVLEHDAAKKEQVQRQLPLIELQFAAQLIAESTGTAQWHQASNPAESGLVPPDLLRPYWQNLKTLATQTLPASSLDDALAAQQAQPSWLWIDCFPALALLRGAPNALAHANVVIARVIIDATNAPADTDLPALQNYMQQHGFVLAGVQPERHPAIGTALFFRDFATIAAERLTALDAATKAKEEQSKQLLALTNQALEAATKIAAAEAENAQLTVARDAEVKAKTEALAARDAEAKAKLEAIDARDAQAKLAAERLAALDAATKAKEEQSKQLLALSNQAQEATKKIATLESAKAQFESEKTALSKQHEQSMTDLRAKTDEDEMRQQMLQQELYRAEVQIDLIKDLLLREPGL